MLRLVFCYAFLVVCFSQYVNAKYGKYSQFCRDNKVRSVSCKTQLTGQIFTESNVCKIKHYAPDSSECKAMYFGPLKTDTHIGGVSLEPYLLDKGSSTVNFTVLNITFTNIKWKKMRFRFQPTNQESSHCRDIVLSNDFTIDDQSILYYDCYWSHTDGDYNNKSHILDFVAQDDLVEYRGQYHFNIPSMQMLSPYVTENEWIPFLYIEIMPSDLVLHIMPPPSQLQIEGYEIEVKKGCGKCSDCKEEVVKKSTTLLKNNTQEVTSNYRYLGSDGQFFFVVTPLHANCNKNVRSKCKVVTSPSFVLTIEEHRFITYGMASMSALCVGLLFVYYLIVKAIRRHCCKDYSLAGEQDYPIPDPPKILVVYPTKSKLHLQCAQSFITYLRSDYGVEVMCEDDISATADGDPYKWADEVIRAATHVVYLVGPLESSNLHNFLNIYEKPISAHKNVDALLLSNLKAFRVTSPKDVCNVFFEHSNGPVPLETKHGKKFVLLKDWQKLISHLTKNMLPLQQIKRTEKGRSFLEDLIKAEKLLDSKCDQGKILV